MSNKKNKILETAINLFVEDGFTETSMDFIAEQSGVAKGTLYYHFDSKEGILEGILSQYTDEVREKLDIVGKTKTAFEIKLKNYVDNLTESNISHFGKMHRIRNIDIHKRIIEKVIDKFAPILGEILSEGNRQGLCQFENPITDSEFLLSSAHFLFSPEIGKEIRAKRFGAMIKIISKIGQMDINLVKRAFISFNEIVNL